MEIQCECGKFQAKINSFPKGSLGRAVCYCDDCQAYLHHLKRDDLLDGNAGTEVIPTYPADISFLSGEEFIACTRLSPKGLFRFSTTCCNTPIANTQPNIPWVGFHRRVFTFKDPNILDQILGPIRSRVMGRFAKGTPPADTPNTFNFKSFLIVVPFMLKGKLLKKSHPSPFFKADGVTPIVEPRILS